MGCISFENELVAKCSYRTRLVISDIEDGVELSDLQYVVDLFGEMQQF